MKIHKRSLRRRGKMGNRWSPSAKQLKTLCKRYLSGTGPQGLPEVGSRDRKGWKVTPKHNFCDFGGKCAPQRDRTATGQQRSSTFHCLRGHKNAISASAAQRELWKFIFRLRSGENHAKRVCRNRNWSAKYTNAQNLINIMEFNAFWGPDLTESSSPLTFLIFL